MFFFLKYLSRSVHDDQEAAAAEAEAKNIVDSDERTSTSFTVWRKSLLISCNGFTVINSNGDLVYRVDNYSLHPQELILMDGSGKTILSMHRCKKLGLGENWEVYEGEAGGKCSKMEKSSAAKWSVKKKKNILEVFNKKVELAYVMREKLRSYVVEGCYRNRSCKVMDESRRLMAEIKRKEAMINGGGGGVHFGRDVFVLVVQPAFDSHFAMALVLLLDQMFS